MATTSTLEREAPTTFNLAVASSMTTEGTLCQEGLLWNNRLNIRFYSNIAVVPCLVIFGTIGNVLSIIIVSSRKVSFGFPSMKLFIRVLAVADILYLWGAILFQTLRSIQFDTQWLTVDLFAYVYPYVWPYMASVQTTETWLVVAIAVDRYSAVSFPLKAVQICTRKRAIIAVFIIVLCSVCFNIPHGLEFNTEIVNDPCTDRSSANIIATPLFLSNTYQITYWSVFTMLIRFGLPLSILLIITYKLLSAIRTASRTRKQLISADSQRKTEKSKRSSNSSSDGDQVTLLLVSVIVMFILCESIEFIMHVLSTLRWTWPAYARWEKPHILNHMNSLGNLMLVVGAAVNFILYCAFARRFRRQVVVIFCGERRNKKENGSTGTVNSATISTVAVSETV